MEFIVFASVIIAIVFLFFTIEGVRERNRRKEYQKNLYKRNPRILHKKHTAERYSKIPGYFKRHETKDSIDDITWNDLEMDRIFKSIDTTMSASGEEYLYYRLRTPFMEEEEIKVLERDVQYFEENEKSRVDAQMILHDQGGTGKYSLCDYLKFIVELEKQSNMPHIIADLLLIVCIVISILGFYEGIWGLIIIICYNLITYSKYKSNMEPYLISIHYIVKMMDTCKKLIKADAKACVEQQEKMKENLSSLKMISSGFGIFLGNGQMSMSGNPLELLNDYMKMIFHCDIIAFNMMIAKIKNRVDEIEGLFSAIGYYDYVIAIGNFRYEKGEECCIPEFVNAKEGQDDSVSLEITDGYHPLIEKPVKNSFSTKKGMLITGSNASGKSTFLKMTAINALLAQTLNTCTATSYKAPFFRILSSMSLRDDLGSGESYYIVEIKAIRRILEKAEEDSAPILCFVDEVLRGTNTVERIAASTEILKSLSGQKVLCMAATHDIELTRLLEKEYRNFHFDEQIMDDDIYFSYLLKEGRATTHNAISLLKLIGYSSSITQKAEDLAKHFTETGNWE